MGSRPVVDLDKCIGAGLCTVASAYFQLSDDGKVMLLHDGDVPESDLPLVSDAAVVCPAEAIQLQKSGPSDGSANGKD
ncbi:ferredoxin [Saccharopolyspora sp. ASAGF58]|uniref:ferredoxin n=1 Tax=Saccharopolyspora sp. ASAGF58 TaxID=2719023 RepID=UPI0014402A5A|nr:ferredoxin [Saccharopolyspora sp. ASAGF58]QIZ37977.1 ferredoxin [Saccharopolyspora sp. ASAGF58]